MVGALVRLAPITWRRRLSLTVIPTVWRMLGVRGIWHRFHKVFKHVRLKMGWRSSNDYHSALRLQSRSSSGTFITHHHSWILYVFESVYDMSCRKSIRCHHDLRLAPVLLATGARSKFGKRSQILRGVRLTPGPFRSKFWPLMNSLGSLIKYIRGHPRQEKIFVFLPGDSQENHISHQKV